MEGQKGRIVIAGGTGFIGRALTAECARAGHEVVVLTRDVPTSADLRVNRYVRWDGRTLGDWKRELEGAAGVVNLSGASIVKRWTEEYKRKLRSSRVEPTRAIGQAIAACDSPPRSWVNVSGIGYYGDTGEREVSEAGRQGPGFLPDLAAEWESAVWHAATPRTKRVVVRVGTVLGREGGALPPLLSLTQAFLGGAIGEGRQWMSWIHIADLARLMRTAIEDGWEGTFNGVAPHPVTNSVFMAELRRAAGRPWALPTPPWAIDIAGKLLGEQMRLVMESTRAVPVAAEARDFVFQYPRLRPALANLLGKGA